MEKSVPDYEAGIYSSFYEGEGIEFTSEQLAFEKIDNTIDSANRKELELSDIKCEFHVATTTEDISTTYYYDNTGMTETEVNKYSNFMNTGEYIKRDKNSIGKHGMGSKFNDYQHSKGGRTIVMSKYNENYTIIDFNYKNMSIQLKTETGNKSQLLSNNTVVYKYNTLEKLKEKINDLYKEKDFVCVYNNIKMNDLINEKLCENGTLFLYNTKLNIEDVISIYNDTDFIKKCGVIYNTLLKEGLYIKINYKNETVDIEPFDILCTEQLKQKYPTLIGIYKLNNEDNVTEIDLYKEYKLEIYKVDKIYEAITYFDNTKECFKYSKISGKSEFESLNYNENDLIQVLHLKLVLLPDDIDYDPEDGGVYIKYGNRIMGDPWWPDKFRKNENSLIRASLEYTNYKRNDLIQPGINKSTRKIHAFINYMTKYFVTEFRNQVDKHKKNYTIKSKEAYNRELRAPYLEKIDEYKEEYPDIDFDPNITFLSELDVIIAEEDKLREIVEELQSKELYLYEIEEYKVDYPNIKYNIDITLESDLNLIEEEINNIRKIVEKIKIKENKLELIEQANNGLIKYDDFEKMEELSIYDEMDKIEDELKRLHQLVLKYAILEDMDKFRQYGLHIDETLNSDSDVKELKNELERLKADKLRYDKMNCKWNMLKLNMNDYNNNNRDKVLIELMQKYGLLKKIRKLNDLGFHSEMNISVCLHLDEIKMEYDRLHKLWRDEYESMNEKSERVERTWYNMGMNYTQNSMNNLRDNLEEVMKCRRCKEELRHIEVVMNRLNELDYMKYEQGLRVELDGVRNMVNKL